MTSDIEVIEYQVRPVTRFLVTRYERIRPASPSGNVRGGSSTRGEYENADVAFEVATALCKAEHSEFGWPVGDARIQYPYQLHTESFDMTATAKEALQSLGLPYDQYRSVMEGYIQATFTRGAYGCRWTREPRPDEANDIPELPRLTATP